MDDACGAGGGASRRHGEDGQQVLPLRAGTTATPPRMLPTEYPMLRRSGGWDGDNDANMHMHAALLPVVCRQILVFTNNQKVARCVYYQSTCLAHTPR